LHRPEDWRPPRWPKEKAAVEAELKRLQDGELKQLKGENRHPQVAGGAS
jgi:hypothetical protein